jgi:hypothetical protein
MTLPKTFKKLLAKRFVEETLPSDCTEPLNVEVAGPVTARKDVVAFVPVAFAKIKFVIVLLTTVALFAKKSVVVTDVDETCKNVLVPVNVLLTAVPANPV